MKRNFTMLYSFLLSILFLAANTTSQAQDLTSPYFEINPLRLDENFIVLENEFIKISAQKKDYRNDADGIWHERIEFSFENKTTNALQIEFSRELVYNNKTYTSDANRFKISLSPQEIKTANQNNRDKTFYIFSKDHKQTIKTELVYFQIKNTMVL